MVYQSKNKLRLKKPPHPLVALVTIYGVSLLIVLRLTQNAFPGVEEWSIYGHKTQVLGFIDFVLRREPFDIRYQFSLGLLAFFPIGWFDWLIASVFNDPVVALRLSISLSFFFAGSSIYFLARFIGCRIPTSVAASVCWLSTIFSMSAWTSMPKLLSIPLFCFSFIGSALIRRSVYKANLVVCLACTLSIAATANPPALLASLTALPFGILFSRIQTSQGVDPPKLRFFEYASLFIWPLTIFGSIFYYQLLNRPRVPTVNFESFDFSPNVILRNAMGRGYWWEYGKDNETRYAPFVDSYDKLLPRFGIALALLSVVVALLVVLLKALFNQKSDKEKSDLLNSRHQKTILLFSLYSLIFLLLSSAQKSIPGFSFLFQRLEILHMFREPYAKFSGLYLVCMIITSFVALEFLWNLFNRTRFHSLRISRAKMLVACMFVSGLMISVVFDEAFPYLKGSRATIDVSLVRQIKQVSRVIDSRNNSEKKLCISFANSHSGEISWDQVNTQRLLMAMTSKRSSSWFQPGVAQELSGKCEDSQIVVRIYKDGSIVVD